MNYLVVETACLAGAAALVVIGTRATIKNNTKTVIKSVLGMAALGAISASATVGYHPEASQAKTVLQKQVQYHY